jgi:uncharacterized protein (DUF2384 family)
VTTANQIAETLRAELTRHAEMASALKTSDEDIAGATLATFQDAVGAAWWLTSPAIALQGRVPLDVSKTADGKAEVLRALARIDRNLLM